MQAAAVEQQGVVRAQLTMAGPSDVAVQEPHGRPGGAGVAAGLLQGAGDDVQAGHAPVVARGVDGVLAGAASATPFTTS